MAQYVTTFADHPVGSAPFDWEERWVVGDQSLKTVELAGSWSGIALEHRVSVHSRRAWAWTAVPGASEVEVLSRFRADDDEARLGVIVRGAGLGTKRGGEQGWTSELDLGGQRFRTTSYDPSQKPRPDRPHGIGRILAEDRFPWSAGNWYWLRLRCWDGDDGYVRTRGKVWDAAAEEPADWMHAVDRSDPVHLGRDGWVGITGQNVQGVRHFDVFSAGTNGDPAPFPENA